ncbi:MAG TPA: CHAT domain-containing protein, partial [Chitinophagaceae bacterium]
NEIALNKLEEEIKRNNPLYHQSFFDSSFISLAAMQTNLSKNNQTLVELYNGDIATYLLVITAEKTIMRKIDKSVFDSVSAAYTHYVSQEEVLNRDFNSFVNISDRLYRLVFGNISLPGGRIIISPGGKYFPFEALVTNTQPLTYFLDNHAVSYTYSARYLLSTFTTSSSAKTFMGMAPLRFSNLSSLPGSDESLNKIQNYFGQVTSYIGHDASKNNFLNEFSKYKIIQLYTHAADNESAGDPVLYFSDSALRLSELLPEQKPATDLIVLSACETASGKLYSGEGVFSFNRSFAALGIPSSVSNLWEIDSRSTYKITELFYKYLSKGMPLDVALQKAKKELKATSENKLPYYWAAPILVGKADAIHLPKNNEWKWVTGIASLAALFLGGWMIRKRNQSLTKKSSHTKSA